MHSQQHQADPAAARLSTAISAQIDSNAHQQPCTRIILTVAVHVCAADLQCNESQAVLRKHMPHSYCKLNLTGREQQQLGMVHSTRPLLNCPNMNDGVDWWLQT
jgi:hypothetical protein